MCLKRSNEKPNSKTINVNINICNAIINNLTEMNFMCLKRSYENPNSKTINVNINRCNIYLILLLNQMVSIKISGVEKFTVNIWPRINLPLCYLRLYG